MTKEHQTPSDCETLEAENAGLRRALAEQATCFQDDCFCSEITMAVAIDDARAALKKKKMTNDAPERIWVQPDVKGYCITGVWPWKPSEQRNVQEYTRADRAQAEKEAAAAAERDAWASYVAQEDIFANDAAGCVEDLARDVRADRILAEAGVIKAAEAVLEQTDYLDELVIPALADLRQALHVRAKKGGA